MRRALLLCLGLVATTWLQFEVFPGHTYLKAGTQIYVPVLERLDAPGYLSRDLVATNPNVTYTVYDEVTLFLHEAARLEFKTALEAQQIFCRAAAVLGVFLLALSSGLRDLLAFLVAMLVNLGAVLPGPAVHLVAPEAVPSAFALGLVIAAIGLLARGRPLLAGLSGGVAFVYHPATAGPFWLALLVVFVFDRRLRSLLRPCLIILFVSALLLANLAQLQPGIGPSAAPFGKLSPELEQLQRLRTPHVWVSLWAPSEIWHYLAIWVCGLWAIARIWPALNRVARWFLLLLSICGILSVPLSWLLLERLRWSLVPQWEPARALLLTVLVTSAACGVAGARAAVARRYGEAFCWSLVVCAIAVNTRILDLLAVGVDLHVKQSFLVVCLAGALSWLVARFQATKWGAAVLLVPCAAMFAILAVNGVRSPATRGEQSILEIADWAQRSTWGSSMFLFPDAGKAIYPGIFRAASKRAVWVDWGSGCVVKDLEMAAQQWWDRWQQTMQDGFSTQRLQAALSFPIDYFVLRRTHSLVGVNPVFASGDFLVYDARDLRNVTGTLRTAVEGSPEH